MKSILEGRTALKAEVEKIAEVAGYLWQNGWAERNGGNITVNITEFLDDEIRKMPAISDVKQIGITLPMLKGCYFYCKRPLEASVCATWHAGRWTMAPSSAYWTTAQAM